MTKTFRKFAVTALLLSSLASLSGCATNAQTGALGGAAGGALIGQAIGHSTGATLLGAALGGSAGYMFGNESDKVQMSRSFGSSSGPTSWSSDNGTHYTVSPGPVYYDRRYHRDCRPADVEYYLDGHREYRRTLACRDSYGDWEMMN